MKKKYVQPTAATHSYSDLGGFEPYEKDEEMKSTDFKEFLKQLKKDAEKLTGNARENFLQAVITECERQLGQRNKKK